MGPPWVRNRALNSRSHRDHEEEGGGEDFQKKPRSWHRKKGEDVEPSAPSPHVTSTVLSLCFFSPSWLRKMQKV